MAKVTKTAPIYNLLTKSSKDLIGRRGEIAATAIIEESEDYVRTLEKKKRALETQILDLTDFGPENAMSLRPVSKDFNPKEWVQKIHELNMDLTLAEKELEVAKLSHIKYCGE